MMLDSIELVCPYCKTELLQPDPELLQCKSCRRSFPVLFGIPDLRVFPDPYVDFETDREKAALLANHFDELSFEEMVRFYYLTTAVVPKHHATQYTRGILAAEERAEETLVAWENEVDIPDSFLEIGSGTAPLLIAVAKRRKKVTGLDIALRWLIVAKKRLQRAGLNLPLICACAEALPFPESEYATVAFDSTLEVVADQKQALLEARRVLKPGGRVLINTPNRYSPGPDPHINLWAGGYLPDRWIAAYARRQNAIPPKRKLLSARSLIRLLRESGFESPDISLPTISPAQRRRLPRFLQTLVSIYNISRNVKVTGFLFRVIGPLLHVTAIKPPHVEKIEREGR